MKRISERSGKRTNLSIIIYACRWFCFSLCSCVTFGTKKDCATSPIERTDFARQSRRDSCIDTTRCWFEPHTIQRNALSRVSQASMPTNEPFVSRSRSLIRVRTNTFRRRFIERSYLTGARRMVLPPPSFTSPSPPTERYNAPSNPLRATTQSTYPPTFVHICTPCFLSARHSPDSALVTLKSVSRTFPTFVRGHRLRGGGWILLSSRFFHLGRIRLSQTRERKRAIV